MPDHSSVDDTAIVSRESVCKRFSAILRAAQANWTDESLSDATGVPARAIKSYRVEGKQPCLANALSIMCVLGKPGVNPIMALIGYSGAPLEEAGGIDARRIVADVLPHISTIAAAAADGHIDHIEAPLCEVAADQIIATVLPLSSAGKAQ